MVTHHNKKIGKKIDTSEQKKKSAKLIQSEENPDMQIISQLVAARKTARKTQADIANAMQTTASAVARLEAGGGKKRHSPSLRTLRAYVNALGYDFEMKLISHN